MAYSWDNRVKYVVRYMYDIDNNGFLDKNDFECLALRNTLIEGRGEWSAEKYAANQKIMSNLWNEIAELADFNKNGEVTVDEFRKAVQNVCVGKKYDDFPACFKTVITNFFKTVDVNGDGLVGVDEYRLDCISRSAFANISEIDDAYNKLCSEEDKKAGGININRYQELYAQFISNPDESCNAVYLFGPLKEINKAYSWDNRVKYVVRYMYDIDNNGFLDKNDFECLALRNTLIEGRGEWSAEKYAANQKIMSNLWNEIAELADFNKDGEVSDDEFKQAVQTHCSGKPFAAFPGAFKTFIHNQFKTIDVNGDGLVGVDEYRLDCISRSAFANISEIDDAYNKLCSAEDKKAGGININRYQELYAQFISNPDETCNAVYLFGPLKEVN
ncbi:uncharacterized protein Scp1 isoform X1 [Palaemon carinicauda]|uniref:uncharacterized protein Scp1 isoform X1 n=1 Tax=Palaemon carinicauda TaxID=392227 RepID=UPI0035B5B9C9